MPNNYTIPTDYIRTVCDVKNCKRRLDLPDNICFTYPDCKKTKELKTAKQEPSRTYAALEKEIENTATLTGAIVRYNKELKLFKQELKKKLKAVKRIVVKNQKKK